MEALDNYLAVTTGFKKLVGVLGPYIAREFQRAYGDGWWQTAVLDRLFDDQKRDLPASGDYAMLVDSLDEQRCLLLMDISWREVFGRTLPRNCKNWVMELKGNRNEWAHAGANGLSADKAARMLDTMQLLCDCIDPETAEELRALHRKVLYGSEDGSTAAAPAAQEPAAQPAAPSATVAAGNLPSWRSVMHPHPDVAEGRYRQAEFAADLAQVARGEGSSEYRDPVEFFGRTYITAGMQTVLVQALLRAEGAGGEPVVQLKTAFGGGKTHTMLALYHLLGGRVALARTPSLQPVLEATGDYRRACQRVADGANIAVLVGTALDPSKFRRPPNMPGITVNTLWGEMAYQLALSAGNPKLYDYVKEADKRHVSPGSEALTALFDACGPCVVLVDELVAYAKKLYGADGLAAGSFDNLITFVQELTEAARASKNSMVVASIPESEREVGGEAGQKTLEAIEHTFGRMEAIWKPVAASEGFEVVRRRLFGTCGNEAARDQVCAAFSTMYCDNSADFPVEAKSLEYREKLRSCYPIHPEMFDRLYEDWTTLETFQRTRGVLRLMAAVIHELWVSGDDSPLIMPGSLPLANTAVRSELTRYLPESWNGVVDSEVDGKHSVPHKTDEGNSRYGSLLAARRVARTVMLGSAPDVAGQDARGLERPHIMLGTVQPGESIAVFRDVLGVLKRSSSYLYSDESERRYWYDTRPTLRKTVEDRMQQLTTERALGEVEARLKKLRAHAPFGRLHACPANSADVADEQQLGLVVLPPDHPYQKGEGGGKALALAEQVLDARGTAKRRYRNMLVFVAADAGERGTLLDEVKRFMAWSSILEDRELLNLDAQQEREVKNSISSADASVEAHLRETYCRVFAPQANLSQPQQVEWECWCEPGSDKDIVNKVAARLRANEAVVESWAPMMLKLELDRVLWACEDSIGVKRLWEHLCSYCYLPRLAGYSVLERAIREGLASDEFFAIAAGVDANGRFIDLRLGQGSAFVHTSDVLVKPDVARRQLAAEAEAQRIAEEECARRSGAQAGGGAGAGGATRGGGADEGEREVAQQHAFPTSFHLSTRLDPLGVNLAVADIVDAVVSVLEGQPGATLDIALEVHAHADAGFDVPAQRTVTENCNTLDVDEYGFTN